MPTAYIPYFSLTFISRATLVVALVSGPACAYQVHTPFWTSTINRALNQRDAYYKTILTDADYSIILLSDTQRSDLCARLALSAPDTANPWYHFVHGILACNEKKTPVSSHFATALALAQTDPGTTWALFVEFTRNRQSVWAERCLMHLEKLLLSSGARAAPVIAQQLFFYAAECERMKEYTGAFSYYAWADRFDPNQIWSPLHRFRNNLPSHPQLLHSSFSAGMKSFSNSWTIQLAVAANCYSWLRYFLTAVMVIIFTGIGLRHLPKAIHPFSDRLPEHMPPSLKTLLPVAVTLSFLSFGYIPLLWFIAFSVWRFLEKKEKTVVALALLLLVCTPLLTRIEDMFVQARLPQGSLSLFSRASEEGYSPEIHRLALEKVLLDRSDALAQLAVSLCAMKKGDTAASRQSITNGIALRPDDPVILTVAGNVAYMANDWVTAAHHYQRVLANNPHDMHARYNLAQSFARKSGAAIDLDFIKALNTDDQARINDFSSINNLYFPGNWPILRHVIAPNYRPRYFWTRVFPDYCGSWKSAKILWGTSFFGTPPLISLVIFIALFVLLLVLNRASGARSRKARISSCRLCDRVLCNHCKQNDFCPSCFEATRYIRNVKTLATIQSKIKRTRRRLLGSIEHALDICAPGTGMLFARRHAFRLVVPIIFLTGMVYASGLFLSNAHVGYPNWTAYGIIGRAPTLFLVYNGIFFIRAMLVIFRNKKAVLV